MRAPLFAAFATLATAAERPNILVILADDLGFSDLGCYGSEIETPALDHLATQGTRLSNFRVNPMCVVTRTSLLTGHEHSQSESYRRSLPLPKALADAGYATSLSGKWHQPKHPLDQGFDEFYGFPGGEINNFTGSGNIMRQRKPEPVGKGWWASKAFTDHTIESIGKAVATGKPFFAFLSFNAPHTPLHVRRELVEKYAGRFDPGWDALRKTRFRKLMESGLIDSRHKDTPASADVQPWDELAPEIRRNEAFRMQTYAAVVDDLDTNVGRLLAFLDETKVSENTIVIFLSDNGGDYSNGDIRANHTVVPWDPKSYPPYMSNGWAYLKCTPFRHYKTSAYEGGVRVPFIIRWPAGLKHVPGSIARHQTHVTDLYPTFLELAGTQYTPTGDQLPLLGKSLVPLLENPQLPLAQTLHPVPWAVEDTTRGYLDHPWKIVSTNEGPWRLFNLGEDPCETTDLAGRHPEKLATLAKAWANFADETAMPPGWRTPLRSEQHGWGFHRLTLAWPFKTSSPLCSAADVPVDTVISFSFTEPLDFSGTKGKTLRLYRLQDPHNPVWTSDPEPNDPAQGKNTVTFTDLPKLQPDSSYFLLADRGWAKIAGEPLIQLNDGAYWFRFRTAK
ncbi:sulfatase-like hydrolase/transferase [Akkermansiaceae bacterium]|nr:sulfatase-like hydrolase/transferase [Akkermansiaceae bacterium]